MRAKREDAIAAAAYGLLEQHSFAGTTMQAIARDSHASMETLYRWYGDKTGLYRALIARNTADVAQTLDDGAAQGLTGVPLLARLGPALLGMLLGPRAIALNRAAAADASGSLGAALAQGGRAVLAPRIAAILQQALDAGELAGTSATDLTDLWLSLLIGDMQLRRVIGALPPPLPGTLDQRATVALWRLQKLHPGPATALPGQSSALGLAQTEDAMTKPALTLYLAAPRGFCAGVDRAIKIVELALEKWGAPVYVRHEIVHNKFVVDGLRAKGAVFVEELTDCPPDRPVIFSAHGVPKAVPAEAQSREMIYVDATCPLVSKVHIEAARHAENGLQMIMIGHQGHPETIGTMGQLPAGEVLLVETVADVGSVQVRDPSRLAFVTQTTLSVDDTADIVAALHDRFPAIIGPHKEDICYATTNRQEAVKAMAPLCDALLVIGAPNSSNTKRLVEVGTRAGCTYAQLIQRATDIDWRALDGIRSVGITAGASAPELLTEEVIDAFHARYDVTIKLIETAKEAVEFKVPRILREPA